MRWCPIDPIYILAAASNPEAAEPLKTTPQLHIVFIIIGIGLLLVLAFSIRYEIKFLSFSKPSPYLKALSIISFLLMFALALVSIFHFSIPLPMLVALVGTFAVLLLLITPIQFIYRMRTFSSLKMQRVEEKARLMQEVAQIIKEGEEPGSQGTASGDDTSAD